MLLSHDVLAREAMHMCLMVCRGPQSLQAEETSSCGRMLLWRGYGQAGLVDSCVDGACRLRRPTAWIDSVGADERDVQAFTPRVAAERGAQACL